MEFLVLTGAIFYCTANGNSPIRVLPVLAITIGQLIWVVHERTDFLVIFGGVAALFALLLGLVLGWAAWQDWKAPAA